MLSLFKRHSDKTRFENRYSSSLIIISFCLLLQLDVPTEQINDVVLRKSHYIHESAPNYPIFVNGYLIFSKVSHVCLSIEANIAIVTF